MKNRTLRNGEPEVPALGLVCMGINWSYGEAKDKKEIGMLLHI